MSKACLLGGYYLQLVAAFGAHVVAEAERGCTKREGDRLGRKGTKHGEVWRGGRSGGQNVCAYWRSRVLICCRWGWAPLFRRRREKGRGGASKRRLRFLRLPNRSGVQEHSGSGLSSHSTGSLARYAKEQSTAGRPGFLGAGLHQKEGARPIWPRPAHPQKRRRAARGRSNEGKGSRGPAVSRAGNEGGWWKQLKSFQ
jgi:hypothetical protein